MMTRRLLALVALGFFITGACATSFGTKRLERMANYLQLTGLDSLQEGVNLSYSFRVHPLVVRVNRWGEIEHIGLKLFSEEMRQLNPLPLYDFLERYLLERLAAPKDSEDVIRMGWDSVRFRKGNPETALQLDGTEIFSESHIDLKAYEVKWTKADSTILDMAFEMDSELLSGCNSIELEENLIRHLALFDAKGYSLPNVIFPIGQNYFVLEGNAVLNSSIRNTLYFANRGKGWEPLKDKKQPSKSVATMMLGQESSDSLQLQLTVSMYGYRQEHLRIPYAQWFQFCEEEGCKAYYGMREKSNGVYKGTVFMVNRMGGYVHMLMVDVSEQVLDNDAILAEWPIKGRLYTYIPMHNVSDDFLNYNEFDDIEKEAYE